MNNIISIGFIFVYFGILLISSGLAVFRHHLEIELSKRINNNTGLKLKVTTMVNHSNNWIDEEGNPVRELKFLTFHNEEQK